DSKRLTHRQREDLYVKIRAVAVAVATGQAEAEEIDRINIYQAGLKAMVKAVRALPVRPQHLLVDARTLGHLHLPQQALIHGDSLSASIAAASVVAKVTRDRQMKVLDGLYPGYGFGRHMGYGTCQHRQALAHLGASPVHRKSFTIKEMGCTEGASPGT
ncbi:MAG: ribonuclease HII, partial [Acidobacteriota bacterium]